MIMMIQNHIFSEKKDGEEKTRHINDHYRYLQSTWKWKWNTNDKNSESHNKQRNEKKPNNDDNEKKNQVENRK